jgi:hypothetical protein
MTTDRKTRDVIRTLDTELDELLIQVRYEPRASREIEKLVGTEEAGKFIQDAIADLEKLGRAVRRAVVAQQQMNRR